MKQGRGSSKRWIRRVSVLAMAAGVVGGTAACDDDAMGPDATMATARVVVTDAPASGGAAMQAAGFGNSYTGSFTGQVSAEIYSEAEGWVTVGSPAQIDLALQADSDAEVQAAVMIPAATYSRVRFRVTGGNASVEAGALLGTFLLDAAVSIQVGASGGEVVVEQDISPVSVQSEANATFSLDLNSEAWIDSSSAQAETASEASFQAAARATATVS